MDEKYLKVILVISFPSVILFVIALKYCFYFCGGLEQLIAIPLFILITIYLAGKRFGLLRKGLTLGVFKMAIISDLLFFLTILFLPAFGDNVNTIWPCKFEVADSLMDLLLCGTVTALFMSIALSRLSLKNAE